MSRTDESGRDGLREAVERLAKSWADEANAGRTGNGHPLLVQTYDGHARDLRALLAEHPPTPAEKPAEAAVEERPSPCVECVDAGFTTACESWDAQGADTPCPAYWDRA